MAKSKSTAKRVDDAYKRIQKAWAIGIRAVKPEEVPELKDLEKREDIRLTKRRRDLITGLPADIALVRRHLPFVLDAMEPEEGADVR